MLILLATKFREIRTLQSIGSPGVHCFLPTRPRFSLPVSRKNLARAASSPGMGKLTKKACNFGFQTGRKVKFCVKTWKLLILLDTKFRGYRTLQSIGSPGVHCFLPTRPRFSSPVSRKNSARAASRAGTGKLTKRLVTLVPKRGERCYIACRLVNGRSNWT